MYDVVKYFGGFRGKSKTTFTPNSSLDHSSGASRSQLVEHTPNSFDYCLLFCCRRKPRLSMRFWYKLRNLLRHYLKPLPLSVYFESRADRLGHWTRPENYDSNTKRTSYKVQTVTTK